MLHFSFYYYLLLFIHFICVSLSFSPFLVQAQGHSGPTNLNTTLVFVPIYRLSNHWLSRTQIPRKNTTFAAASQKTYHTLYFSQEHASIFQIHSRTKVHINNKRKQQPNHTSIHHNPFFRIQNQTQQ